MEKLSIETKTFQDQDLPGSNSNQSPSDPTTQKVTQEGLPRLSAQPLSAESMKQVVMVLPKGQVNEKVQDVAATRSLTPPSSARAIQVRPNIDRSHLQQSTFATLTRNIPNCPQMLEAHGRQSEVNQLTSVLQQGNLKPIIAQYGQLAPGTLALDALKALSQGKITMPQFCTLSYCDALLRELPGVEVGAQSLFDAQGNIDPVAQKVIAMSLYQPGPRNFFTQEEAREVEQGVFENMRNQPLSEQSFFYIPFSSQREDGSIGESLRERIGLKTALCIVEGKICRIIPSFSMMQAYVDAHGKENTVALCPTIGTSTRADFRRNAAQDGREIFNPFPGYPAPGTADGFSVRNSLEFLFHDFYHCLTCSQIPAHLRRETGHLADIVAHLQQQWSNDENMLTGPFLDVFYGRLIDMEFPRFCQEDQIGISEVKGFSKNEIFLTTLELLIFEETAKRMDLKLTTMPSINKREGLSASTLANLTMWDPLQKSVTEGADERMEPDEIARRIVFTELYKSFLKERPLQQFALVLYQDGLLTRLGIKEESLDRVHQGRVSSRLTDELTLSSLLKSIYIDMRKEEKS